MCFVAIFKANRCIHDSAASISTSDICQLGRPTLKTDERELQRNGATEALASLTVRLLHDGLHHVMEFTTSCGELMLVLLDAYKGGFFGIQDKIGHGREAFDEARLTVR